MSEINDKKRALRAYFKEIRDSADAETRRRADRDIFEKIVSSPQYRNAKLVLTYVSSGSEPDTLMLIVRALADGKKVACPRCDKASHTMQFLCVERIDDLRPGAYGLFEPDEDTPAAQPGQMPESICVVPGLAFDSRGGRLGYGGGYYDRFLAEYSGCSIGLCRESCMSEVLLPSDEYDIPVDMVVAGR